MHAVRDLPFEIGPDRRHWLREAAHEEHVPAMYEFGLLCQTPEKRRYWLRKAAEQGHLQAMHDYALSCNDPHERRRWLREAARNGWQASIVELAESEC